MSKEEKNVESMEITNRKVILVGLRDIMFDRYAGDNETQLLPEQKMYYAEDGKTLVVPSLNLFSFLSAENSTSCAKKFGKRNWRDYSHAFSSFISIEPDLIPLTKNGKKVVFNGKFNKDIYIRHDVARLRGGIPHPLTRPVVRMPWELSFEICMFENEYFSETLLRNWFEKGGLVIGLGNYRPVFGKFKVEKWE